MPKLRPSPLYRLTLAAALLLPRLLPAQTAPAPVLVDNSARKQLIDALDRLASTQTSARRAELAHIATRAEAEARQAKVRATMLRLLGPLPAKTPLNPHILGESTLSGIRIQRIVFDSQPNFHVTALLYLPDPLPKSQPSAKLPAIVIAPGHSATGKASDFLFAAAFARNGFAVLSYDPIGQGERLQYPDPAHPGKSLAGGSTGEHGEAGLQPVLLGESIAKYFLWDGIRAVDYLLTRPDIDPARIGAFGCSGGGSMTALLGALDPRVAAIGTACYITSLDALLPTLGPQDAEQSTPGWLAAGLDFPDWIELAAPRPYAVIATASDMFPFAGTLASTAEARRVYALFDAGSAGTPPLASASGTSPLRTDVIPTLAPPPPSRLTTEIIPTAAPPPSSRPTTEVISTGASQPHRDAQWRDPRITSSSISPPLTAPTLNPDTPNAIPPSARLQLIAGPGGHGNLLPIQSQILSFFLLHLAHSTASPILSPTPLPPAAALQVTPTGQVATSYPNAATVFSLNLAHAHEPVGQETKALDAGQVREVIAASAIPGAPSPQSTPFGSPAPEHIRHRLHLQTAPGIALDAEFYRPTTPGKHPTILFLRQDLSDSQEAMRGDDIAVFRALALGGTAVIVIAPRPSIPGSEDFKSPLLGPFYLLGLRAELVGKTLLGMRVDDVIRAIDYTVGGETIDPANITAHASGHLALVLLHAAVLDSRLKHITLHNLPPTYAELLANPLPKDAPENLLPGVLQHYDTPDLIRLLGSRVTIDNPALSSN